MIVRLYRKFVSPIDLDTTEAFEWPDEDAMVGVVWPPIGAKGALVEVTFRKRVK